MPSVKRLVLYHRDSDGFGAAYACHCAFRGVNPRYDVPGEPLWLDDTTYISVQYNEPVPDLVFCDHCDEIFIVDFSYKRDEIEAMREVCAKVIIIDHHRTAQKELEGLEDVIFDMNKSGAVLAWEYFFEEGHVSPDEVSLPDILRYVQDRDLWKWELPNSREVNLYIATLPWEFGAWDKFDLQPAVQAGSAIASYEDSLLKKQADAAYMGELDGHKVPFVNCTWGTSEMGDLLCKKFPEAPFVVLFQFKENKIIYSLRSQFGFDVSAVAKNNGGGGHAAAAGFSYNLSTAVMALSGAKLFGQEY